MSSSVEVRLRSHEQLRRLHFEELEDGRLCYSPHGVRNILSRSRYVVSEAEVPGILALHMRLSRWLTAAIAAILFGATLVMLSWPDLVIRWVANAPWLLFPAVLAVAMLPVSAPGLVIPRLLGPWSRGPARTWLDVGRHEQRRVGSLKASWLWFGACAIFIALGLGLSLKVMMAGSTAVGISLLVVISTLVPVFLVAPMAATRLRLLQAEHERLDALVAQRTEELREFNASLEARAREQVQNIERLGQLKHFFSAPVAEMILGHEGFDPGKVHRREISVVSIDLRGFTAFAEAAEPEEVIALLRVYHAELGILVKRHGATLEHFAGDGATIFLNDPVEIDDHARDAVRLATELRDAMRPHLAEWRQQGFDLGMGAGIAVGYATIGAIGYEGRWEYAAIGNVCNLAERLCAAAKDGQVLVTRRLSMRVQGLDLGPLGELTLKGFAKPVAAFDVKTVD